MIHKASFIRFFTAAWLVVALAAQPGFSLSKAYAESASWAIYMYICGSDLETDSGFATDDILEMLEVELPENVTVVIQTGGANEWWNEVVDSSAMYRLEYNSEGLYVIEEVESASMGAPETLEDFLNYCENYYPADRKSLIFWDHGGGSGSGVCFDELYDKDYLSLAELRETFGSVYGEPDEPPFDIIGFDACLMASIDTAAACRGYGDIMVASQETEPAVGWKYNGFLAELADDPDMDGEALSRAICYSYLDGCEEYDVADKATLSAIDLYQIGGVIDALDAFSVEGIITAINDGPGAFFADYGRGAKSAEYYSDGGPEMVDLVSLVMKNSHIFTVTADTLIQSVADSVICQVTGPFREQSNGISVYYPYEMDGNHYENFSESAASEAMSYLYQLLMSGELSDEGLEYFTEWLYEYEDFGDYSGDIFEEEYEFADISEYGLEDYPVYIYEEDDITYACLDIGPDAATLLQSVTFMLALFSEDGEESIILGEEFDISCDWEEGFFVDNFRGVWGAIDEHIVMMEVASITDNYILYDVPILLNGRSCSLSVAYLYDEEAYKILTATPDTGESAAASKEQLLLMPGDEVTTLLLYMGESTEGEYYENETFTVSADTSFDEIELPDGYYGFMFLMTDYRNNTYGSDVVGVVIEDGYIEMIELE